MMNLCASINVYYQQIGTLLVMGFSMLAFTNLGKKSREEAAYISFIGLSLFCLCNIFLSEQMTNILNTLNVPSSGMSHGLCMSVMLAAFVTACLMVAGKHLKVKSTAPKTLFICFFVGAVVSSLALLVIDNNCSAPAKTEKSRG